LLVLVRLAYLAMGNVFAALRLIRVGEREKGIEILVLRHQLTVLRRQLGPTGHGSRRRTVRFLLRCWAACLAACWIGLGCWCARTRC
jgi:hypothetical protein